MLTVFIRRPMVIKALYALYKALDKVRPGGVGMLDQQNPTVRRYIVVCADFLGAIRLPDTTFKASAGMETTAAIFAET